MCFCWSFNWQEISKWLLNIRCQVSFIETCYFACIYFLPVYFAHANTNGFLAGRKREIKIENRMDRMCFHRDKSEHCGDYRLPSLNMFFISHGSRCYRRFFIRDRKYTSCRVKKRDVENRVSTASSSALLYSGG